MSAIDDEERAARLARAIISDIILYHESEIATHSPNVNGVIEEGRGLFQQRVATNLHTVFERAIADSKLAPRGAPMGGYRDLDPTVPRAPAPAPAPPQKSVLPPLLLLFGSIALAVYYYVTWYRR